MAVTINGDTGVDKVQDSAIYDDATTSTGFFALPSGTTAQRPGSPANGYT